jgi:hypothetical protein
MNDPQTTDALRTAVAMVRCTLNGDVVGLMALVAGTPDKLLLLDAMTTVAAGACGMSAALTKQPVDTFLDVLADLAEEDDRGG